MAISTQHRYEDQVEGVILMLLRAMEETGYELPPNDPDHPWQVRAYKSVHSLGTVVCFGRNGPNKFVSEPIEVDDLPVGFGLDYEHTTILRSRIKDAVKVAKVKAKLKGSNHA